jgi:hypothetical protein
MDSQEKMLRELLSVSRENNDMLRAINAQRRLSNIWFVIKWAIIIALAYGAYQAAVPMIQSAQTTINQINTITNDPLKNVKEGFLQQLQLKLQNK